MYSGILGKILDIQVHVIGENFLASNVPFSAGAGAASVELARNVKRRACATVWNGRNFVKCKVGNSERITVASIWEEGKGSAG